MPLGSFPDRWARWGTRHRLAVRGVVKATMTSIFPFLRGAVRSLALFVILAQPLLGARLVNAEPAQAPAAALPFFAETGFRIGNERFADYFQKRGGVRTFGYPVS